MSLLYSDDGGSSFLQIQVLIYKTTQFHIPEDSNLNIHHREKQNYHMCDVKYLKYATYVEAICPKNSQQ